MRSADDGDLDSAGSSQIADCVAEPVKFDPVGDQLLYNPSAFAQPADGQVRFGSCGPNNVRGPSMINVDLGVFRKFTIGERVEKRSSAPSCSTWRTRRTSSGPTAGT